MPEIWTFYRRTLRVLNAVFMKVLEMYLTHETLSSENKNLMIFDDVLLEKQNKCESYYIRGRHSNVTASTYHKIILNCQDKQSERMQIFYASSLETHGVPNLSFLAFAISSTMADGLASSFITASRRSNAGCVRFSHSQAVANVRALPCVATFLCCQVQSRILSNGVPRMRHQPNSRGFMGSTGG